MCSTHRCEMSGLLLHLSTVHIYLCSSGPPISFHQNIVGDPGTPVSQSGVQSDDLGISRGIRNSWGYQKIFNLVSSSTFHSCDSPC